MTRRATTAVALLALACAAALGCIAGGDDDDASTPAATATAGTTAPAAATPAATAAPAATPAPAATASPTPAPTAAPPSDAPDIDGVPFSLDDFASALPAPGLTPTDEFEPTCPGASAQAGRVHRAGRRRGRVVRRVGDLWVYADHEAFKGDWAVGEDFRVAPLLDGCEPPTGFVYWHENLVLWFAGLYGPGVAPGSLPATTDEVRGHPVVRAFLELTWQ